MSAEAGGSVALMGWVGEAGNRSHCLFLRSPTVDRVSVESRNLPMNPSSDTAGHAALGTSLHP